MPGPVCGCRARPRARLRRRGRRRRSPRRATSSRRARCGCPGVVVGDRRAHRVVRAHAGVSRRARPSGGTPSAAGQRRSKLARSIRPHSRSASALGSSLNARRTSGPSRAWKASNESSMLVVSTPPQSIRSALATSRSAGSRCRGRGSCGGRRAPGRAPGTPRARASRASPRALGAERDQARERVRVAPSSSRSAALRSRPASRQTAWRVSRLGASTASLGSARGSPGAASSRPCSAARRPKTKHSLSEFEASRLAPCRPVQAHSPTAYRRSRGARRRGR